MSRQREAPIERCATALERAGALVDLLIAHVNGEDRVAVIGLDTVAALIADAAEELAAVEAGVQS